MAKRQSSRCRVCVGECSPDHVEQHATCAHCGAELTRYGVDGFWFDSAYTCAGSTTMHEPKRQSRDWRDMTRQDFDADAGPAPLFELEPGQLAADDGHGTADLLELV